MAKKKKTTQGIAIAALLLNIFIFPTGIGTIVGGDTKTGVTQLILSIVGMVLSLILIGIPLVIGIWIWGLVSAIKIVQEAE
ncbi:MAG: hypothetical protein ABH828_00725 [archaeon]